MKVDVKKSGPCQRKLKISLEADAVSKEYEEALSQYAREASLPGFRKGKAPRKMVESRYAKDIREDVGQRLVSKAYHDAVAREELEVVAVMDMEEGELKSDSDFTFSVTVDVAPEFKLPNCDGIKISSKNTEPEQDEIDRALESVLERYASYEDVDDRPVQKDDMVKMDYSASIDGVPLKDISPDSKDMAEKEDYWVLVNEHAFLPEMENGLIGCELDGETSVEVKYDENLPDKNLAGKTAVYKVKVKAIRGKRIPELTEDLLKQFDVESEEELRGKIKESLAEAAAEGEKSRQRDEICSYLLKKTKFDVPQSRVDEAARGVIKNILQRRTRQGETQEKIESEKDEILNEATELATERVKLEYILNRIRDEKKVEVCDDELQEFLEAESRRLGVPKEHFVNNIEERSSLENVKEGLRTSKTLDILLDKAIIK